MNGTLDMILIIIIMGATHFWPFCQGPWHTYGISILCYIHAKGLKYIHIYISVYIQSNKSQREMSHS